MATIDNLIISKQNSLIAINSSISGAFALVIIIATLIIEKERDIFKKIWVLDPSLSIVFAVFMIGYGLKNCWCDIRILIVRNRVRLIDNKSDLDINSNSIERPRHRNDYITIP